MIIVEKFFYRIKLANVLQFLKYVHFALFLNAKALLEQVLMNENVIDIVMNETCVIKQSSRRTCE